MAVDDDEPWVAHGTGPDLNAALTDARDQARRRYGEHDVPPGAVRHQDLVVDQAGNDRSIVLIEYPAPTNEPVVGEADG